MTEVIHDPKFEALVDHLKRTRGFDFSGYKRSSLIRRVRKRMREVEMSDFVDYMDYLQVHPEEFRLLFNTILINVTSFFRDPAAWQYMRDCIVPQIIANRSGNEQIRIWSAACASGEEAYSLAILFAEALGPDEFRERVKIYATDADEAILREARQACYPLRALDRVPEELREKYFSITESKCTFKPDYRRAVIFGCHDLVQDPPISKLDLVVCRNALMYFNTETQARVLARLHFSLVNEGYLFLGKAEMLLTHSELFLQTDLKHRVFVKTPRANARERLVSMIHLGAVEVSDEHKSHRLREGSIDSSRISQIVVDTSGILVIANKSARELFGLAETDIGKPLQDLEISYRPVELRSLIEQAYKDQIKIKVNKIERVLADSQAQYLELELTPIYDGSAQALGVNISFSDVTLFHILQSQLEQSNQDLGSANQELQSAHEELETTNEELQSTNEELETTNEELQSTNEELETMNEELQSTNEELETMNSELKMLTDELNSTNSFLHSVLSSMNSAVVALDVNFKILIWNNVAHELWGLSADEVVGESFWGLDIGLPIAALREGLETFMHNGASIFEMQTEAVNRRGKDVECNLVVTRLSRANRINRGILMIIQTAAK